jgi:hypothetical protein
MSNLYILRNRFAYFLQLNRHTDLGSIEIAHRDMNVGIAGIHKSDFWYSDEGRA